MDDDRKRKAYDLEERTFIFAKRVREFVPKLPKSVWNQEDIRQLVDASGSVGANYIEANESLGKKDFLMHAKISRKEAKESNYWLRLVDTGSQSALESEHAYLVQESKELTHIFGSIITKFGS